jgi:uncharacterized protein
VTPAAAIALVLLGCGVGAFGTLVGAGGGFLLTPILLLVYPHDSPGTITAISLAVVWCNAISGSGAYAWQRRIDYRSGWVFAAAGLPGAVLGASAVNLVARSVFDALMGIVLLAVAVWLLVGKPAAVETEAGRRGRSPRRVRDRDGVEFRYSVAVWRGALFSAAIGFASSFLGIGGGILHVPVLIGLLGFPVHIATATSHFVLAWVTGAGVATHLVAGDYQHAGVAVRIVWLAAGVIGGAQLGARMSRRASGAVIKLALAVSVLVLGARLVLSALLA